MPFTPEEFLDVFEAYNEALWPWALALWLATAAVFVAFAGGLKMWHALPKVVLAIHWLWAGLAYHVSFFTAINPAAWGFAALFIVQALIVALVPSDTSRALQAAPPWRRMMASALIAYGLFYPAIVQLDGFSYPRMPTFGVPCPTTILTCGFLLAVSNRSWVVGAVPIVWSFIAGSAAWPFGVHADLVLPVAGALLAIDLIVNGRNVMRKLSFGGVAAMFIGLALTVLGSPVLAAQDQHQHEQQQEQAAPGGDKKMTEKMMADKMGEMKKMDGMMAQKKATTDRLNALMARMKSATGDEKVAAMADVVTLLLEERTAMQEHCASACSTMMKK